MDYDAARLRGLARRALGTTRHAALGAARGATLVVPACNTEAMNLHLAEIATEVAPGKHAVLVLDQAGWHLSAHLAVPDNVTLIVQCADLNPAENVWEFVRDNWLANRFASYTDLVDTIAARPGTSSSNGPG